MTRRTCTHGPQWIADEIRKAEKMTDKTDDGYEIVPPLSDPARKGVKCGECGMKFEDGKAYGFVCPSPRCPIQMRVTS